MIIGLRFLIRFIQVLIAVAVVTAIFILTVLVVSWAIRLALELSGQILIDHLEWMGSKLIWVSEGLETLRKRLIRSTLLATASILAIFSFVKLVSVISDYLRRRAEEPEE